MAEATIVVPCFNESRRLPADRFRDFLAAEKSIRFVLVNDGSRDDTLRALGEVRKGFEERVEILDLERNRGKAEAVRRGLLHALAASPRYLGFWDADLSTPLDAVPRLCWVLDGDPRLEMVFGSRVKLLGRRIERHAWRHYLGRVFATAVSRVLDLPVYDTQCGAKIFRATPDLRRLLAEPFETRWLLDVEILARLIALRRGSDRPQARDVIYEYPLEEWVDAGGSKLRPLDFFGALVGLVRIRNGLRSGKRVG